MAVIPINSGTGPGVAVDSVGTQNIQVVKIMQAADGATAALTTGFVVSLLETGTVNVVSMPVLSATNVTVASLATGTVNVVSMPVLSATNVTIASIATGTVTVKAITTGTVDVVAMPVLSATNITVASIAAITPFQAGGSVVASGTGTGPLIMGIQTGATLAKPIAVTTTGYQYVLFGATQAVTAAGVTIASITTGTVNLASGTVTTVLAMPVLSASNVTVASVTTGTMNIATGSVAVTALPVVSGTGLLLGATTAVAGAFVSTAHASRWDAYAVNTTSGSATILKTSGAHTLYVTDVMVSVDVPMMVTILSSAATAKAVVYLATKGGFVMNLKSPMALNSAQSLCFQGNASGSCAAFAAGYTVT